MVCAIIACNNQGLNSNFCKEILKQRAGINEVCDSDAICEKHYDTFIKFFTFRCKKCCDPFEVHAKSKIKNSRKKSSANALIVISSKFAISHGLITGKKICKNCYQRANESKNTLQDRDVSFESDHLESIESSNEKSGDTLNWTLDESIEEPEVNTSPVDNIFGKERAFY